MHSSGFFRIEPIARLILKREISGSHTISDQSLLLSTIVLNDMRISTVGPLPPAPHDYMPHAKAFGNKEDFSRKQIHR